MYQDVVDAFQDKHGGSARRAYTHVSAGTEEARAVFKGKVMAIQLQPGRKKMVYIQHGNYITVYKNLKAVAVKSGQTIKTKQQIGTIHTDAITGKTILEFALFKNTAFQNPENWISQGEQIVASAGGK